MSAPRSAVTTTTVSAARMQSARSLMTPEPSLRRLAPEGPDHGTELIPWRRKLPRERLPLLTRLEPEVGQVHARGPRTIRGLHRDDSRILSSYTQPGRWYGRGALAGIMEAAARPVGYPAAQ